MKHPLAKFLLCAVTATFLAESEALAKSKKNKKNKKRPMSKTGSASELPTIDSVGKDYLTVKGKDYYIHDYCKIQINGEEGDLKYLSAGMQVSISARVKEYGRSGDSTTYWATRIVARENKEMKSKEKEQDNKKKKR